MSPGKAYINVDFEMKNWTKYRGQSVRLRCEITGNPVPKYTWRKDDLDLNAQPAPRGKFVQKSMPWGHK